MNSIIFIKTIFLILFITHFAQGQSSFEYRGNFRNLKGDKVKLKEYRDSKTLVLVFYSSDCPLCKKYTLSLNLIYNEFGEDVQFFAIFSGKVMEKIEISEFIDKYEFNWPVLLDPKFKIADQLSANVTPEVFVIQKGDILYRGAIDDWVISLGGNTKREVGEHYLRNALNALYTDQKIDPGMTRAKGCFLR